MLPGIKQFDLSGRTVLVTGGSKGLGKAMADGFASAGANLFLVSRNLDEATAAAKEIKGYYPIEAFGYEADVTNEEAVSQMVNEALGRFGQIDVLVNNAGINRRGPIEGLSYDDFKAVQEINANGVCFARAVLPHMKGRGMGRIINLSAPGLGRHRQSHPLHGKQRRRYANDEGSQPGTCGNGHHGQCDLPKPSSPP